MRDIAPVSPGELLLEEFLNPMGITQYRLAKEIGVSQRRIGEIVAGKRSVTADTDLRLCRFFRLVRWLLAPRPSSLRHYDRARDDGRNPRTYSALG
ncbi:HigA family addiction module antitoxin [Methylocaldum gracile subsp. desertum]|uniref:HigA family addiction module antitoxin n=1 Tax=Methylocaldum sp. GT1BW TaxID=3438964 RepID=UPI003DA18ABA